MVSYVNEDHTAYSLNQWRDRVHATAVEKGWWDPQATRAVDPEDGQPLHGVHVQRTFGDLISLVHSEASEALEEHRAGHAPDRMYAVCQECKEVRTPEGWPVGPYGWLCHGMALKPEGIPAELADVIIRVLDIAGYYGIDIEHAIMVKAKYNEGRPYRHGEKAL